MNWAFVDYENVRSLESINLAAYQRVFVFCGPQNKSIKFDELPASGVCRVDLITVPTSSKNNVDFHLAFHLGIEHNQASADVNFHVISNDKGYQGLINHLELLGRSCKLVEPNVAKKTAARKTPGRKASGKATDEMALSSQNGSGQNDVGQKSQTAPKQAQKKPEQKMTERGSAASKAATSKSGASKQAIGKPVTNKPAENKAAAGTAASNAKAKTVTKIKIKASSAAALSDAASKLFAQLQITGGNRPKTKARVLSWLKSHVKSLHVNPEPSPDSIFDEWKAAGMLSLSGSAVRYPDA